VICLPSTLTGLKQRTLAFYTGMTRSASNLLRQQDGEVRSSPAKQQVLKRMVGLAGELKRELESNNLDTFGEILHANWELKKSLTDGISSPQIDDWYEKARRAGASGGKLLGAGNGGFLMFYAREEHHDAIRRELSDLRCVELGFERRGSTIIFVH
jgi:D-glycero-alpha-D-manno-heptose-7-phosphate kinase